MPAKLAETDAAILLERRRAQNRKAQKTFRSKKLAAEAEAKQRSETNTNIGHSPWSATSATSATSASLAPSHSSRAASSSSSASGSHHGSSSPEVEGFVVDPALTLDAAMQASRQRSTASSQPRQSWPLTPSSQPRQPWASTSSSQPRQPWASTSSSQPQPPWASTATTSAFDLQTYTASAGTSKPRDSLSQQLMSLPNGQQMDMAEVSPFESFSLASLTAAPYTDPSMIPTSDYSDSHDASPSSFNSSRSTDTSPSAEFSSPTCAEGDNAMPQYGNETRTAQTKQPSDDSIFEGLDWINNGASSSTSSSAAQQMPSVGATPTSSSASAPSFPSEFPRELLWMLFSDSSNSLSSASKQGAAAAWWNNFWTHHRPTSACLAQIADAPPGSQSFKGKEWPLGMQIAQLATNESGMLAVCVFLSAEGTLEGLRRRPVNGHPFHGNAIHVTYPFMKAFYHNAITLGYLEEDLRETNGVSRIKSIWANRGLDYTYTPRPNEKATLPWPPAPLPTALSQAEEEFRMKRLRESVNLHPTLLQLNARHPSIIDVLPWPSLRDTLLALVLSGALQYKDMKGDILGRPWEVLGQGYTFEIHGDDPGDEEAWELSEAFARKYRPILPPALVRRTNWWRRLRGYADLTFDPSVEVAITAEEARETTRKYQEAVERGHTFFKVRSQEDGCDARDRDMVATLPDDVDVDIEVADQGVHKHKGEQKISSTAAATAALTPPSAYISSNLSSTPTSTTMSMSTSTSTSMSMSNLFDRHDEHNVSMMIPSSITTSARTTTTTTMAAAAAAAHQGSSTAAAAPDTPTMTGLFLGLDGAGARWD